MNRLLTVLLFAALLITSCDQQSASSDDSKNVKEEEIKHTIVTLNPTSTEILFALGMNEHIVLRDVTSVTPEAATMIPLAGDRHSFNIEAILNAKPTVVFGSDALKPELLDQIRSANVDVVTFQKPESIEHTKAAIDSICSYFGDDQMKSQLLTEISCEREPGATDRRCLFVYAAGGGNLLVGGGNTSVGHMIVEAGGVNVAEEVDGFKPLSTEALVEYDPECLIMFEHGFHAVGGIDGVLAIPGLVKTKAGKNQNVISFPAHAISGFGLKYCQHLNSLHELLKE